MEIVTTSSLSASQTLPLPLTSYWIKTKHIMEDIIKKAIEGGYENYPSDWDYNKHHFVMHDTACQIILDPLFWQALGKSCGWEVLPEGYKQELGFDEYRFWDYEWQGRAMQFHETNLLEGWEKAIEYLKSITT